MAPPFEGLLQIILVGKDSKFLPVLSEEQVRKIPQATFDEFLEACEKHEHGYFTAVYIKDERHYLSIQRTIQWITKGKEAGFLVDHACTFATRKDIQMTRTSFAEEVDHYAFGISARFNDLRDLLSERIRSYPVYSHEIAVLLEKLYPEKGGIAAGIDDRLHRFIGERIMHFRDVLKHDPKLLPALIDCVAPAVQLGRLLPYIDTTAISSALPTLREGVDNSIASSVLLKAYEETRLATSASTAHTRNAPIVPTAAPLDISAVNKVIANTLFDGKSIVVPHNSGFSRLLATADGAAFGQPNHNFRYHQLEYLLVLGENATGWLKVCNKRREVGEIAKLLVLSLEAALERARSDQMTRHTPASESPVSEHSRKGDGNKRRKGSQGYRS